MNKTFENTGYWALILGGSSGIGLASAQKLAAEGMNICIVHRDRRANLPAIETAFEKIKSEGVELLSFNVNAISQDGRSKIIEAIQGHFKDSSYSFRVLLHSIAKGNLKLMAPLSSDALMDQGNLKSITGVKESTTVEQTHHLQQTLHANFEEEKAFLKSDDFALTIEAMATSYYDWIKAIWEKELFAKDARCIALTSQGSQKAWRQYAAVAAAKAALEAIARSVALEMAPYGLRSNIIQAGITDTASLRMIKGSDQLKLNAALSNPFQRLTLAEDVANVVYLLSREEAAWINGAIIPVDGGENIL